MRLLPGKPADIAGESISSYSLIKAAVNKADVLPRVWQVFSEEASLSSFLAGKELFTKGLYDGMNAKNYRVVGSNHVIFPIANTDKRKPLIVKTDMSVVGGSSSATFYCPSYPNKPAYKQSVVYIALNSNWARPNEVIEFNDNKTLGFIYDDQEPINAGGAYIYAVKVIDNTKERENYIDTSLLAEGNEVGVVMNMYEHDFSKTGHEKYTFDGHGHAYMTLQRVKMSASGTAAAMSNDSTWFEFVNSKGEKVRSYIDYQEKLMWKRIAAYHDYQIVFGQGTVTVDGEVVLKNKKGRDIMAGDGIMYQNEGAYERPINGWSMKYLEAMLRDLYISTGKDGKKEVLLGGGFELVTKFSLMMVEKGFVTLNNNVEGSGSDKGVNLDYSYFEFGGIRIIPKLVPWYDSVERPNKYLSDGTSKGSWDGFMLPLGNTEQGEPGIELVQLRPPKYGTISGIDKGGAMATSVDGTSEHVLIQSGVIRRNKIYRIFRPYSS